MSFHLKTDTESYATNDLLRFTAALQSRVSSDDLPVAIVTDRSASSVLAIAACWLLGRPIIPLPFTASDVEYEHYLSACEIGCLIASEGHPLVAQLSKFGLPKWIDVNAVDVTGFSKFEPSRVENNPDKLFGFFFTSGTSGKPKTVPLRRKHIIAAAKSSSTNFSIDTDDMWAHTLPMHHIGGISIISRALLQGFGIRLLGKFDPHQFANLLRAEDSVVGVSLVPTQLKRLLDVSDLEIPIRFKGVLLGGGPIDKTVINKCITVNLPVSPSFGMTETAAQCLSGVISEWKRTPPGSCGKPLPGVQADLRPDETGFSMLWLKSAQIFDGYLSSEEETTSTFDQNGWFCTGDYARIDTNGYIFIEMRRTDRIVSGGENINPLEIEAIIKSTFPIDDVAVVGLPDAEWGQRLVLVVAESEKIPHDFKQKLAGRMSNFKIPKEVYRVHEIPKTAAGKIRRQDLVDIITNGLRKG